MFAAAPVPEPKTRRVVDMPRGWVIPLKLRLVVVRDSAGIPEEEGEGAMPLAVRLTVGEIMPVGVDVLLGTRRGDCKGRRAVRGVTTDLSVRSVAVDRDDRSVAVEKSVGVGEGIMSERESDREVVRECRVLSSAGDL